MERNGKSIKDMLREGFSAEFLMRDLEEEIITAQDELDRETSSLTLARFNFVKALYKYEEELGIIEKNSMNEEEIDAAAQALELLEPDIKKYIKVIDVLFDDKKKKKKMKITKSNNVFNSLDDRLDTLVKGLMKD